MGKNIVTPPIYHNCLRSKFRCYVARSSTKIPENINLMRSRDRSKI